MNDFSLYIAGASSDIERAEKWIHACRERQITVTSTWPENIRKVQAERKIASTGEASNPKQATDEDRYQWSMANVLEVRNASHLWILYPTHPHTSQGAYFELAVAWMDAKGTIGSGGDRRFIYSSVAEYKFEQDEQAFDHVIGLSHQHLKKFAR